MASLYVANCTRQGHVIYFRVNFTPKEMQGVVRKGNNPPMMSPRIEPGHQIVLGGDQPMDAVESLVQYLCMNQGAILSAEVNRMHPAKRYSYALNVDHPVSAETIRRVYAHNMGVLTEEGRERREAAGVQAAQLLSQTVAPATGDEPPPFVAIEIEQEGKEDADSEKLKRVEEGYRVENNLKNVPDKVRRAREKKRAMA